MLLALLFTLLCGVSQSLAAENIRFEERWELEDPSVVLVQEEEEEEKLANDAVFPRSQCTDAGCDKLGGECRDTSAAVDDCEYLQEKECTGSGCLCCIDCQKDVEKTECGKAGGKCKKKDNCGRKEYADANSACKSPNCGCCLKCKTSEECANGASPGHCVTDIDFYTKSVDFFRNSTATCTQSKCACFNRCVRKKVCASAKGYCVKKGVDCRSGEAKFGCGCRDSDNCSCCVKKGKVNSSLIKQFGCSPSS